jgi:hypothetical protein
LSAKSHASSTTNTTCSKDQRQDQSARRLDKSALRALEEQLQICRRQTFRSLPSWHNVIQRKLTIPGVHLQKPLALGS